MELSQGENKQYTYKRIHSIEKIEREVKTYDIENLESDFFLNEANFFANDLLVHNSKHAGGVVVLDRPVYELIPVERVGGMVLTAFPESGSDSILDELGLIKFDILGISVLDIISNTIGQVKEELYLIEDDDGIKKIVPESYVYSKQGQ